jgi:hypothetical protein
MKKQSRLFLVLMAMIAVFVTACGGTATADTSAGGDKPRASLVEFTGVIEAMDGNQWTVNGQIITVDPAVLRDGPFAIGDTVKVEAEVQADGSVVVTRVEPPLAADTNDNSNENTNDDNSNTSLGNVNGNSNDNTNSSLGGGIGGNTNSNSNESLGNSNSNDDNSNDNDNSNDDGNSNTNDDDSNDDNSGSGGGGSDDDD